MNTGKTQGYVLTFRCIKCRKHEVFANYPTEAIASEDRIRSRVYQVRCSSCGWNGEASGISAVRISRTMKYFPCDVPCGITRNISAPRLCRLLLGGGS